MKTRPIIRMVGLVAIACLSIASIYYIESFYSRESIPTPKPTPTVSPTGSQDIPALSLGTVAIQTFSGSTLARSGSGAVISSDGLIVTLAVVAPYGSGSYVYQVATSTGSLLRAQSVWRSNGLVILKLPATDLNAVLFDNNSDIQAGIEMMVSGAFVSLSRYIPLILPANIAYSTRTNDTALSIDRTYLSLLAGARVVDDKGRSIGLIQPGNYIRLIPASVINAVVEEYLARKK